MSQQINAYLKNIFRNQIQVLSSGVHILWRCTTSAVITLRADTTKHDTQITTDTAQILFTFIFAFSVLT